MGSEARCTGRWQGRSSTGKALLETDEVVFRGTPRVVLKLSDITAVTVDQDTLVLTVDEGDLALELGGAVAARWAARIREPPSLAQKLGVKPGLRVAAAGLDDELLAMLRRAGAEVTLGLPRAAKDMVLLYAAGPDDLARLPSLKRRIEPDGAVWLLRAKGRSGVAETAVLAAARDAGLVDVKVARVSDALTGHKLVIPRDQRR